MPFEFLPIISAAPVAAARLVSIVPTILAGILGHAPHVMISYVFLSVSSNVSTTAIASSVPAFLMVSISASVTSAYVAVSSAPTASRPSTLEFVIATHQFSGPKPESFSNPSQRQVLAL